MDKKVNLVVAGAGEGFRKLYPLTKSKSPDLRMRIHTAIDIVEANELAEETRRIIDEEEICYFKETDLAKLQMPEHAAGVIMTPNASHLTWTKFFVSRGVPVYVEKPVATNLADLEFFLEVASKSQKLVYAAEYCTDGKALGLLAAAGVIPNDDPRIRYLDSGLSVCQLCFPSLGKPKSIHGSMLEGMGSAGTADHRAWLLDGKYGGMIRDLCSHLFGALYDIGFATADVIDLKVTLGRYEQGAERGTYRPLKDSGEGETYAKIEGKFLDPLHEMIIPFEFEVGKYWPNHDRCLSIEFENEGIYLDLEKPFRLLFQEKFSREECSVSVTAEQYASLAFLDFRQFIKGKTDGHIGRAAAIVRFNEAARNAGLVQAGLL